MEPKEGTTAGRKPPAPPRVCSSANSPRDGKSAMLSSLCTYYSHGVTPRCVTHAWYKFTMRAESGALV